MSALLEMRGIVRCFGAVRANDGIDLEVQPGEIVGLLGENGSGKSTLMKVLFGMVSPDEGKIIFRGRELTGHRPGDAMSAGIAMIHQHFMLIDAMTVVENVMLGWPEAGRILKTATVAERVDQRALIPVTRPAERGAAAHLRVALRPWASRRVHDDGRVHVAGQGRLQHQIRERLRRGAESTGRPGSPHQAVRTTLFRGRFGAGGEATRSSLSNERRSRRIGAEI